MKKKPLSKINTPGQLGCVSAAMLALLRRQVAEHGIVVWYDPQKAYAALVGKIDLPHIRVLSWVDSFFRLREQLEPFVEFVAEGGTLTPEADVPPQVILYVPKDRKDTAYALIEAETVGVVVEPHASVPECDSRLGRLTEQLFAELSPSKAIHLARQADEGLLTLEELDRLAEDAESPAAGSLQVIFGHVSAEEMLLQFTASDTHDENLLTKAALSEVLALAESEVGWSPLPNGTPSTYRTALRRYLLCCDLTLGLAETELPDALGTIRLPESASQRDSIVHLCRLWRNRSDLEEAYREAALLVERDLYLTPGVSLAISCMEEVETFESIDRHWTGWAAERILQGEPQAALAIAGKRLGSYWSRKQPELLLEWRVIESAAELLTVADKVISLVRSRKWSLDEFLDGYTRHTDPWMRLDRLARELEARHARWEATGAATDGLEQVLARAQQCYISASAVLAESYSASLRKAGFGSGRSLRHTTTFKQMVSPLLQQPSRTAFLMVDALRYEMAVELVEGLEREFEVSLQPLVGQLPGITTVGMAALLPIAEQGLTLEAMASGVEVRLGDQPVGGRKERLEWLAARAGVPVCVAKLGEVLKPAFKRRKDFSAARLLVITSQEIDLLGEEGDEENIRIYIEDILEKLRRALRMLVKAGVERIVIAGDHGFLYLPSLDPGLNMNPPGGTTATLHPRVWIGRGGTSGEAFFRVDAAELGLGGTQEVAFPLGLSLFKVKGGSRSYLHGGISPAENILPLITLTARLRMVTSAGSRVRLSMAKSTVTNRLFSVTAELIGEGLQPDAERRLRFEVLAGQEEVGQAATAAYGFEDGTREVTLKMGQPNVVTLMLSSNLTVSTSISVRALDCETQVVLDTLKNLPVSLSM